MDSTLSNENQNRRISLGVSIGFHGFLLLLFIMLTGMSDGNYGEGDGDIQGVQVNFGTSEAGMGDDQQEAFNQSESTESAKPGEVATPQEAVESTTEEDAPEPDNSAVEDGNIITANESPVEVNAKKDVPKASAQKKPVEAVKPEVKKVKNADGGGGKDGFANSGSSGSNGNQNVMGDQGKVYGEINQSGIYDGKPGNGGDGLEFKMDGWDMDYRPDKVDDSNEKGFVEFTFEIDERGRVLWSKAGKKSFSPSVVKFYKDQLDDLTFSKTGKNIVNFKGWIRFEVKAQ